MYKSYLGLSLEQNLFPTWQHSNAKICTSELTWIYCSRHTTWKTLQGLLQPQQGGGGCHASLLCTHPAEQHTALSRWLGHVFMECKLGFFLLKIRKNLHKWIIVHASTSVIKCAWQFLSGVCISQLCLHITVMLFFYYFHTWENRLRGQMFKCWDVQTKKFPRASGPFHTAKHSYPTTCVCSPACDRNASVFIHKKLFCNVLALFGL